MATTISSLQPATWCRYSPPVQLQIGKSEGDVTWYLTGRHLRCLLRKVTASTAEKSGLRNANRTRYGGQWSRSGNGVRAEIRAENQPAAETSERNIADSVGGAQKASANGGTKSNTPNGPSARTSLALLDQYQAQRQGEQPESAAASLAERPQTPRSIAEQLQKQLAEAGAGGEGEVVIPLGQPKAGGGERPVLTVSQKRNIRRQALLNRVSERNDAPFFTSLLLLLLIPPAGILAFAVVAGIIKLP